MENKNFNFDEPSVSLKNLRGGDKCVVISDETSRRITSLRFLLAVLVVFIHNNFSLAKGPNLDIVFNQSVFGKWVQLFISDGFARCAVPLFFVFAGYLQSVKNENYLVLLKKKTKSLFIPFVLWTLIYLIYYGGIKLIILYVFPSVLKNPQDTILSWSVVDWFYNIFGYSLAEGANVIPGNAYQFWFVRDLIVLTVISPVLIYLVKKRAAGFVVLMTFLFLGSINTYFVQTQAIFAFVIGLYWGIYNFDLFKLADKFKWIDIVVLFAVSLFLYNYEGLKTFGNKYFYCCVIIFACVIMLKFSKIIISSEKWYTRSKYLAQFSFWIYAIHNPALNEVVRRMWLKVLPMKNGALCLAEYFGVSILVVVVGLGFGIVLKKVWPKFYSILCGGR